jgi:diguanylate cyclase (GGDEF)-like protein
MAAIDITPAIHYRPVWVGASILFGILASGLALGLTFRLRQDQSAHPLSRLGGAVLMGLGISGTHYLGMAAAHFVPGAISRGGLVLNSFWCAATIALAAGSVLACTLISDLYTTELAARARAHAGRLRQINAQLRHQALHDALTGLPNRTAFLERLRAALTDARTGLGPFAVLALDLDRFKLINDSLGHSVGDELLREVTRRLRAAVRSGDTVARLSGDEFLVLARQVRSPAEAGRIAESIIEALSKPLRLDSLEVLVSTSIGISLHPGDADSQETLLAHADEAMYSAKRRGGRTWQCFAADMNGFTQERLRLESDLHRALERGQFELHYQPRVDVVSGRVSSVEALLRWRHPERGYIPPLTFIPIAE